MSALVRTSTAIPHHCSIIRRRTVTPRTTPLQQQQQAHASSSSSSRHMLTPSRVLLTVDRPGLRSTATWATRCVSVLGPSLDLSLLLFLSPSPPASLLVSRPPTSSLLLLLPPLPSSSREVCNSLSFSAFRCLSTVLVAQLSLPFCAENLKR